MRPLMRNKTMSSLPKSRPCPRIRQQRHNSTPSTPEPSQNQQSKKVNKTDAHISNNQSHSKQSPTFSSSPPTPQNQPPSGSIASSAGGSTAPVPARSLREVIQAGPVGRLGRAYSRAQQRRPYVTQLCSSVVVYLCGDLSAQLWFPSEPAKSKDKEDSKGEGTDDGGSGGGSTYDPYRTMRHLTVGIGSSIPSYNWFMFLHNHFNFPSKFLSILTKVCVQQSVFTPVFNTYFFSVHSLLSGSSFEETFERLKKALPVSITNSVKLWPAVTAFSFMYVPPQFRNVFAGIIAVGWQTYLSWLNQKAAREVQAAEAAAGAAGIGGESSSVALRT